MTTLQPLVSFLSGRAHSWRRQALFAGRTSSSSAWQSYLLRETLWTPPHLAKFRHASSNSTRILSAMTPTTMGDGNIYFLLHERIPRGDFNKVLEIFRGYKKQNLAKFDWKNQMWKMESSVIQKDGTLFQTLQTQLRKAGIYLRPLPGERPTEGAGNDEASKSSFEAAVESIMYDDSNMVAITQQSGAFLILTPNSPSEKLDKFDRPTNFWDRLLQKESGTIDRIIRNDLSGVTDLIDHTFEIPIIGHTDAVVYQTYDVWLVAELLELLSEKISDAKVVISEAAQEALDQRFTERQERRKPTPELENARNPDIPLHPHQIEGIRFFMDNNGRGLLGDEMGLGK